jgi:hypothetical protein
MGLMELKDEKLQKLKMKEKERFRGIGLLIG